MTNCARGIATCTGILCGFTAHVSMARDAELRECAQMQQDELRLACYDEVVSRLPQQSDGPERKAAEAEQQFGAKGTALARQQEENKEKLEEVAATVAALAKRPRGERMITLDNGQVWVEETAAAYFPVKVGEQVSIEARALGSYRMRLPSGRSTRVSRVK